MKKHRKFSKVLSFVLGLALILGMSAPAFAEPVENPPDMDEIIIKKNFLLTNEDTVSPNEEFKFTILFDHAQDTQYEDNDVPVPYFDLDENDEPVLTGSLSFAEGDAELTAGGNATKEISLNMPDYDHVGIYTYKLTEAENNTAGVTYDSRELFIKVYVINNPLFGEQGEPEFIRYAVLYELDDLQETIKVEGFENEFSAGYLDITKIVEGNMGEKDRYFLVTLDLTAPGYEEGEEGADPTYKDVISPVTVSGGSHPSNPSSLTFTDGKASIELQIKDGDSIRINNLPYGVTWEVAEADYTGDDYTITINDFQMYDGEVLLESVTDEIEGANAQAEIINYKEQLVETGIILDNLPYLTILVLAAGGLVGFVLKRRRSIL